MNERICELAEQAGSTHKQNLGVYQFYEHEMDKFVELIVEELVSKMQVEGSEFYYNEPNDHGCVTVKFFVPGNPQDNMRGEEVMGNFADGVRGTGCYRLNSNFVQYLLKGLK